ncbi:MAG: creatininase family protein [Lachnospiraceae bacterium]
MRLRNLSWKQLEKVDRNKPVIIPTGAIEVYGPHLPMGGDAIVADMVADIIAERLDLLVTPTIEMGDSLSLVSPEFPGTMVIKPENFKGYLEDVCTSLIRWGFKKIFFFNTHISNNFMITQLGWELEDKYGVRASSVDWWRFIQPHCEGVCEYTGMMAHGHASEAGTSVLKYLTPEYVDDSEAVCTLELFEDSYPEFKQFIKFGQYTNTGTLGDATKGTAEKGKIIVDRSVDRIVEFIEEYYK